MLLKAIGRRAGQVADSLPSCDGALGVEKRDGALLGVGLVYSRASRARRDREPGFGSPPRAESVVRGLVLRSCFTSSARGKVRATVTTPALSGEEGKVVNSRFLGPVWLGIQPASLGPTSTRSRLLMTRGQGDPVLAVPLCPIQGAIRTVNKISRRTNPLVAHGNPGADSDPFFATHYGQSFRNLVEFAILL